MKTLILAAVFLAATPAATLAAGCQAAFGALTAMLVSKGAIDEAPTALVRERPEGWCGVRALRVVLDSRTNLAIEEFAWRGEDMDRFVSSGLPPRALEISAKGVRMSPTFGDAAIDEEIAMSMLGHKGFDLEFAGQWEQGARQVVLRDVLFRKPSGDQVRLSATIDNVDLTSIATIQMSAGSMAISRMSLAVNTVDAFVPFFSGLSDADPADLEELLTKFSEDALDEESREALRLLSEHGPVGQLDIDFFAEAGFGSLRLLPYVIGGAPPDVSSLWDGVVFDVSFSPR